MGSQEEQLRKRKIGEAQMKEAANDARKTLLEPKALWKKTKRTHTPVIPRYGLESCEEWDDDEDEATLKRETDPPVSSARAPKEQQLNCPPGTYVATPHTDITRQCGLFRITQRPACAGCRSSSHRLNICMKASQSDGLMNGCPWCNTLDHSLTNCPDTKHDLAKQLELIRMRANMPFFPADTGLGPCRPRCCPRWPQTPQQLSLDYRVHKEDV